MTAIERGLLTRRAGLGGSDQNETAVHMEYTDLKAQGLIAWRNRKVSQARNERRGQHRVQATGEHWHMAMGEDRENKIWLSQEALPVHSSPTRRGSVARASDAMA
jgi:hypothetical protein